MKTIRIRVPKIRMPRVPNLKAFKVASPYVRAVKLVVTRKPRWF